MKFPWPAHTPSGSRIQQPVRSLSVVVFAGTNRHVDRTRKIGSRSDDRQNGQEDLQVSAQKCLLRERRCISSRSNADQLRYGSPNVDSKGVTWWIAAIVIATPRKDRGVKDDRTISIGIVSARFRECGSQVRPRFEYRARCSFSEYNWCTVLAPDRGEIRTTGGFFYVGYTRRDRDTRDTPWKMRPWMLLAVLSVTAYMSLAEITRNKSRGRGSMWW